MNKGAYARQTAEKLGDKIKWKQVNRDSEMSQRLRSAKGKDFVIVRKTVPGPTVPTVTYRLLIDGQDELVFETIWDIAAFMDVEPVKKGR